MSLQLSMQLFGTKNVELPRSARTRSGVEFDPSYDFWFYRDGVNSVKLDFIEIKAPIELCQALKLVLTWYAEHLSPSHLRNVFERFKHFASTIQLVDSTINSVHLINYRRHA
jgi:hypothetical protein